MCTHVRIAMHAQDGGVSFLEADGTYRVLNSSNGVPVTLAPGQTALSAILVDSQDAQYTITTTTANVSGYLSSYSSFYSSGYVSKA
jgi:hypothetical protein